LLKYSLATPVAAAVTEVSFAPTSPTVSLGFRGEQPRIPQNEEEATYTPKRTPEMGEIDWTKSATELYNFIRGITHPYPGAFTFFNDKKIMVWSSKIYENTGKNGKPGEIIETEKNRVIVQTGDGALELNISSPKFKKGDKLGD
ncbi:MAG: hypothetical protein R6U26_02865, partial [Candidatus Undinarchaeales archaeon]